VEGVDLEEELGLGALTELGAGVLIWVLELEEAAMSRC
jgi:hypothetical protein